MEVLLKWTGHRDNMKTQVVKGKFYGKLRKRRKAGVCNHCKGEINIGDEVYAVEKRDGYYAKNIGLFHQECFTEENLGKKKT